MWLDMGQNNDAARLKAQIDENLKRVYNEAMATEVPDKFKELLEKLRQKEVKK